MGYLCDFCGEQRSLVYCRSDAACLCFSCDRNVHSANTLSRCHSRTIVCERCNSQPAYVRCVEDKVSLIQNCDWLGHGTSASSSTRKRQSINCSSGCPSCRFLLGPFIPNRPDIYLNVMQKIRSFEADTHGEFEQFECWNGFECNSRRSG